MDYKILHRPEEPDSQEQVTIWIKAVVTVSIYVYICSIALDRQRKIREDPSHGCHADCTKIVI
jgi:hypothetical protein